MSSKQSAPKSEVSREESGVNLRIIAVLIAELALASAPVEAAKEEPGIEVRRGFGEIELSTLAPNEFVTASGLHDNGYIVWRKFSEPISLSAEEEREKFEKWIAEHLKVPSVVERAYLGGHYTNLRIELDWEAWQAAASRAESAPEGKEK